MWTMPQDMFDASMYFSREDQDADEAWRNRPETPLTDAQVFEAEVAEDRHRENLQ
jgi:hypothetical protein